jgi:GcrA cell cycle regulator
MNWTEERIEQLKLLWADGKTSSQIATAMKTSSCAVLGKVNRLGLSNRDPSKSHKVPRHRKVVIKDERFRPSDDAEYPLPTFLSGFLESDNGL